MKENKYYVSCSLSWSFCCSCCIERGVWFNFFIFRWWIQIQVQNMTWNLCAHNNPVWSTLFILSGFYFKLENQPILKILALYTLEEKIEVWMVSSIFFHHFLYYKLKGVYNRLRIYAKHMSHKLKINFTIACFYEVHVFWKNRKSEIPLILL